MKAKLKLIAIVLITIVAIAATGCSALQQQGPAALKASGIIEATEFSIAPELSGRVLDVKVNEGDTVQAGDELFRLDDTLLQTQRQAASADLDAAKAGVQTAQAGLDAAQAQYQLALSAALAEDQPNRLANWKASKPGEFAQPGWYFSKAELLNSAQAGVSAAKQNLAAAQARLDDVQSKAANSDFLKAEERLANARAGLQIAQAVLDRTNGISDGQQLHDAAQSAFDEAKSELDNAQKTYDETVTTQGAQEILKARAELAVAQERYNATLDALRLLQTGPDSPVVAANARAVDQAKAVLEQAQAAVAAAQANLEAVDAQIEKLTVRSPANGVILTRSVQPGEVLQAGVAALTIGKLDELKITVYLPEDRYGEISLGGKAAVSVDSFPNQSFPATVTRIADQAEYTPRNIQTQAERQTTVYAIQLSVPNPGHNLIPGMPADVEFTSGGSS